MVNHHHLEELSQSWQEYSRLMAEQDMEITRKDDQYANLILQSDAKMYKRMEMCEQQIGALKKWMNETYERDSSVLRTFKQQLQEEKEKAMQEALSTDDINETFKDLEKYYKQMI